MIVSTTSFATVELHSREMTCSELKTAIANYREVIVIEKTIFGNSWTRAIVRPESFVNQSAS
jgi:hypothetical protein